MALGDQALDAMIRKIEDLGENGLRKIAGLAAPLVAEANQATAAAGTTPSGEAWKPKRDGSPALRNAAAAVEARVVQGGQAIQLRLIGTATGSQRVQAIQNWYRPILPELGKPLPKAIVEAIRGACSKFFVGWSRA